MKNTIIKWCLFIAFPFMIFSQNQKLIINPPPNIKTVLLRPSHTNSYAPIIELGERLTLEFDDLDADEKEYHYFIEHYTYHWDKSELLTTEYLNGFNRDRIRNYENSFNTLQPYTHYKLHIPNNDIQLKISGNYIISVYLDDPDSPVFTRRFVLYEPLVHVGVSVHRSRKIDMIDRMQAVQFTISHPNFQLQSPGQYVKTVVLQNDNWNTAIYDLKPQFIRGNQLLYRYDEKTSFPGGNEFLHFDTKNIKAATVNIQSIQLRDIYHHYLYVDQTRADKPYTYNPDINGNYSIRTINDDQTETEADYSNIHFYLEAPKGLDIYVYGSFNNWQITDQNKLTYNKKNGLYQVSLPLKQGFYNYGYIVVNNGIADPYYIDGSFYQTENDYMVLVYYRSYADRYDRAIGMGIGNSEIIKN